MEKRNNIAQNITSSVNSWLLNAARTRVGDMADKAIAGLAHRQGGWLGVPDDELIQEAEAMLARGIADHDLRALGAKKLHDLADSLDEASRAMSWMTNQASWLVVRLDNGQEERYTALQLRQLARKAGARKSPGSPRRDETMRLLGEAMAAEDEDHFIAEWATSSIFDPDPDAPAPDYDAVARYLRDVYRAAHVTVREIRQHTGLTQAGFSKRFAVPRRTLEDWERGVSACPPYVRALLAQAAGMVNIF